ncbi:hypothetical protein OXX80_008887 [Metschnikowia pulcherrima]
MSYLFMHRVFPKKVATRSLPSKAQFYPLTLSISREFSYSRLAQVEANANDQETGKTHSLTQAANEKKEFVSTHDKDAKQHASPKFELDSVFLLSIPITTKRSFIYCHHNSKLLSRDQLDAVPWLARAETKLVSLAAKAWHKLVASDMSVNKKIVVWVSKLLNSIPYNENCLRSFPSKEAMVRELTESSQDSPRAILTAKIDEIKVSPDQLKPVPVYHASSQTPDTILEQMHSFKKNLVPYHRKWAALCAIGIPITLPVALVPVAPNVPGFYLAYRLYCHIQALRGARNLGHLLESEGSHNDTSTHLTFKHRPELDTQFSPIESGIESGERMLIDSDAVDKLVDSTGLIGIKDDLYRAFKQESERLKKVREAKE